MKIEDQVCSLDQAKKLKELGVKLLSLFHHIDNLAIGYEGIKYRPNMKYLKPNTEPKDSGVVRFYSAYTVAELGQILPDGKEMGTAQISSYRTVLAGQPYSCDVLDTDYETVEPTISCIGDTEAQARAGLLILLLETGKITADQVNKRLTEKLPS